VQHDTCFPGGCQPTRVNFSQGETLTKEKEITVLTVLARAKSHHANGLKCLAATEAVVGFFYTAA